MNDVVVHVTKQGAAFHAAAVAHTLASSPELAAKIAAARALDCSLDQVVLSEPTRFGVYAASKKPAEERRSA
ncbi:MAG: hypothetical protein KF715_08490 [Candidatus Didemnitutus sp.]|nr:hypothetical protein [Candidatus Didemnitutus sp.]